ncbi:unknown [Parabacteroides johnsonii CAG:246]|nr:unknown [Parabacteroides johnsonii CAG:246]
MFDQSLSATIGRVSFTGEYELDRILFVVYDLSQTIQVGEQQVSTFVSCETATETDQQSVRVDLVQDGNNLCRISLVLQPVCLVLILDICDQLVLQSLADRPDVFVRNILDRFPIFLVRLVFEELLVEMFGKETFPFGRSPSWHVYAVGHISYVQFIGEIAFPYRSEHALGYFSMQPAYAVCFLASIQSEYTHRELLVGARVFTSHIDKFLPADT